MADEKNSTPQNDAQHTEQASDTKLQECEQKLAEVEARLMRTVADFDNYKKRAAKDFAHDVRRTKSALFEDILMVIDGFDRALAEQQKHEDPSPELAAWMDGLRMLHTSFYAFLERNNVREIADVTTFDPALHEALVQIDSDDHASGQIVAVLEKGFTLDGIVLRPAKVSVAK